MTTRRCIICDQAGTLAGFQSDGTEPLFNYQFKPAGGLRWLPVAAHRSCMAKLKEGKVKYDPRCTVSGVPGQPSMPRV